MTSSFIISDGTPVARISGTATAGVCWYSWQRCREALNTNRDWNLVSARKGTVSNAARWQNWELRNDVLLPLAEEINEREFFVS